jgi:predicted esterase YcpF (UPF0227 family)
MIYFMLHGFASATPNESSQFFEENVLGPGDRLVNLNYRFNEYAAEDLMDGIDLVIDSMTDEYTFVGCSLGGYMAQYMARMYMGKAIVINPAVIPYEDLSRFLGVNTNYRTAEVFDLTDDDVKSFKHFAVKPGIVPTLVLLDMGDELLSSADTVKHFAGKAVIRTFEGGSHRFEHMPEAVGFIREFANTLV